jgi:CRP-like cAMP-binding protein
MQGKRPPTQQVAPKAGFAAQATGGRIEIAEPRAENGFRASSSNAEPRASSLRQKLAARTSLSAAELDILGALQGETRAVATNRDIITEGYKYGALLVLLEGIAIRYRVLHDGRRQILNIVLPGDFMGFPTCFFELALYSVTSLTDAVVTFIPFAQLSRLFGDNPRVGAAILWIFSCEAAMYAERLVDIGRRSALERVANFLLELLIRLRVIGLADDRSFRMPLTQELIGDILGLTSVHVSRTLRQLRADGLVGIEGQQVTIRNFEGLSALADFGGSYLSHFRMSEALFPEAAPRRFEHPATAIGGLDLGLTTLIKDASARSRYWVKSGIGCGRGRRKPSPSLRVKRKE